jgi:transcriptional regulator with XRE-family HTH domain
MEKLIAYLKDKQIPQVQFAARIGITQSALSKMCGGVISPSLQTIALIEKETGGDVPAQAWFPAENLTEKRKVG